MQFTDIFVRRPILAFVVSALFLMVGLFSLLKLPIRQYPMLESSTITISTQYPGATADLMQGFVTQPIAQAIASVEGIDYLSSSSTDGTSLITARMELNADSTEALTEIMAKVNEVRYKLPQEAYDPVIERTAGDSTAVAYVAFASESLPTAELTEYISRVVVPVFTGIEGVAKIETYGGQTLAMRLWIDAELLAGKGLTAHDVANAIRQNNYQSAPGRIDGQYTITNIRINSDLASVQEFEEMVVATTGEGIIRLKDIGHVELTSASRLTSGFMDGQPAVYLGFFPSPSGNPLVIVDGIKNLLPEIEKTLPPNVKTALSFETARFIQASIDGVVQTLIETLLIVIVVIYLCLGSFRSVLIPIATIPLSMLGVAVVMLLSGFSINLLTLLAMVLAIGLVVDDAIVVVENIHRHIDDGKTPVVASIIAAREVIGPVIAMTITLAAVYAPIGFMGGLTGALFKEFALTLAGSVLISGIIALVLSPVMSSYLLPAKDDVSKMADYAERFFNRLMALYGGLLTRVLRYRYLVYGAMLLIVVSLPLLYMLPQKELAPMEDQANLLTAVKGPQHVNLQYTENFNRKLDQIFQTIPEVESRWIINGTGSPASSIGGIILTPWGERTRSALTIQTELQAKVGAVEGNSIFVFQIPALPGSSGGLPVQMVLRTPQDYRLLYDTMEDIKAKAWQSGLFVVVDSDLNYNKPVVEVTIDRLKSASLGISLQSIGDALAVLVGENYINRFSMDGRAYDVIPQSHQNQRMTPEVLGDHYVRSQQGTLIPLSALVSIKLNVDANQLNQFNQQNAATLEAIPAPGVSMGQALAFLESVVNELPSDFSHDWQSDARQFKAEGSSLIYAFGAAILIIYLVLAAQYESLKDPLIILVTVPLSICGALLPLALGYASLNIYTQIGLVTLIGLISKHGILMVAFANNLQREGFSQKDAIVAAAKIRLRPILMTTAALVFGLIPLLFASGAGAMSRFGLGLVIIAGMLIGTIFTLFILPSVYIGLGRDLEKSKTTAREEELDRFFS